MSSPLTIRGVVPASLLGERPAPPTIPTGIAELDVLTGGLPRGALSELCGPVSSGCTSVLLALMAESTRRGEVCALVDASDCFDPQSADAAGVELRRVLWIRCSGNKSLVDGRWPIAKNRSRTSNGHRRSTIGRLEQALKVTDLLLQGGGFGLVVVDLGDLPPEIAQRVPLTSWFRFRRVVENTPTVLLVLEQEPHARSCASVVLKLSAISSQLSASRRLPVAGRQMDRDQPSHAQLLHGLKITAEIVRTTQNKKPARSATAQWESQNAWVS